MSSRRVPGAVRAASMATWLLAPVGLALIVIGALEIAWWSSADAARLMAIFDQIERLTGVEPPYVLRGGFSAQILIALGLISIFVATLARQVRAGWRWARTLAAVLMTGLLGYSLIEIGIDATIDSRINYYLAETPKHAQIAQVTQPSEIQMLLPPVWYPWFEDIAQGCHVLALVIALTALFRASLLHDEYFLSKADTSPRDLWGPTLEKIRADARHPPS